MKRTTISYALQKKFLLEEVLFTTSLKIDLATVEERGLERQDLI